MRSDRNDFFGYQENRNREITPLITEFIPGSKSNKSSHDKKMTTETSQSSREGQKRAQDVIEKLPIVYEDKTQSTRNLDTSSFDTNGNKGLTEPCSLNNKKKPGKTVSFENQSECDKKESSAFQYPQKFVEVSEEKKIVAPQQLKYSAKADPKIKRDVVSFKESEKDTENEDADYTHRCEPIKKDADVKCMIDSTEDSKKEKTADSQTKAYITKIGENNESIKGLIKKVYENQFQPVMKMTNTTDTNESDDLKAVAKCYLEEKATELAKISHEADAMIENSLNKDSLSCSVKDEKDYQNSARPRSPYPDFLQSVPAEDLNRKTIAINENSIKSVNLACIEEEENDYSNLALPRPRSPYPEFFQSVPTLDLDRKKIAGDENSTERKYVAGTLEEQMEKPNSTIPRPRSPYSDFLHIVPEDLNSTDKCFSPVPEIPVSKINGTSKSNNTNPVDEKPLNLVSHLICSNSFDLSVPEIPSSDTKSSVPVHEVSLYATNGTSKSDKTNSNEEKPLNSTLRLIPYILPDSSASELSDTEPVVELKKIAITSEKLKPAPTIPITEKNGKSPKRMSEMLSSIPNPFKRRSKSFSPQLKPEIPKIETDEEIKNMTELQSQKPTNQSIYKLAYNESITDSSSTHSRSLSPVDREKLIPRNTFHDEIVVFEADSDSEPGSEDLELLPHRYDCDTFQNRENNLYINKLSLAVELIRTQEELPYDDQFKRIVEDSLDTASCETNGEENLGFEDESPACNVASNSFRNVVVTSPPRRSDNLATTGVTNTAVDTFTDSCEEAVTTESRIPAMQRNTSEETRAINRRFRGHVRHYLSTRTFGNPCLCCILM